MSKHSTSRTAVYYPEINSNLSESRSVNIRLPLDMDIFRMQIQLSPINIYAEFGILSLPFLLVSSQPIVNATNGIRLYIRHSTDGSLLIYQSSETLILDRRGTDSIMRDDIHIALYDTAEEPLRMVCNVLFEGYIK